MIVDGVARKRLSSFAPPSQHRRPMKYGKDVFLHAIL